MKKNYIFYTDQLKGEYKRAFDKVELYSDIHAIYDPNYKEKMMCLLDALLTGQKEEVPVEEIIGPDMEQYCKDFFEKQNMKNRGKRLTAALFRIFVVIAIFETITLFAEWTNDFPNIFTIKADISMFFWGALSAVVVHFVLRLCLKKRIFKLKHLTSTKYGVLFLTLCLGMLFLCSELFPQHSFDVPVFPVVSIAFIYILAYKLIQMIQRKKETGCLRKPKEEKRSFWKELNSSTMNELPKALIKRYERINKKRMKKGKAPLTKADYTEKLRKENRRMKILSIPFIILFILILTAFSFSATVGDGIGDRIFFFALLTVFEGPILYFFFIRTLLGKDVRSQLFAELDLHNEDIFEYEKRLEEGFN